jgi:hypothetical protein
MSVLNSDPYARAVDRVLRWCDWYTRGLAPAAASDRRSELQSDLWEHARWAERTSRSARGTSRGILLRAAKGAPADLSWRRAQQRSERMLSPHDRRERRINLTANALVLAAASVVLIFGASTLVRNATAAAHHDSDLFGTASLTLLGFTLMTAFAIVLLMRARARFIGALAMAVASVGVIHFGLRLLEFFSATISELALSSLLETWATLQFVLLCGVGLFFLAAAALWLPARRRPSLERASS